MDSESKSETIRTTITVTKEELNDPYDLFDTSISTIFSIPPIAFSPDQSGICTYNPPSSSNSLLNQNTSPPPKSIHLKVPAPSADNYTILQAHQLWLSSIYLADEIFRGKINVRGKFICELGAGAGLPGIAAAINGGKAVSTDWDDEDILNSLKWNFENNISTSLDMKRQWHVIGHRWGTDVSPVLQALSSIGGLKLKVGGGFDIIILADTLWMTSTHSALLKSIADLLSPGGIVHITAGLHTGRGPIERFKALAEEQGGSMQLVNQVKWSVDEWDEYNENDHSLEEERGVVVHYILTFS